jgi:anti-sigma factor RsiW
MSTCRHFASLIEPYVDGELVTEKVVEVEQHIEECEHCAARVGFDRSLKKSVRNSVYQAAPATPAFLARLGGALEAERQREAELIEEGSVSRFTAWRKNGVSLLAAAAAVLLWARVQHEPPRSATTSTASHTQAADISNVDQFIEDLVENHVRPAPVAPAVTEPAKLEQFDPEVGVPVRAPQLMQYGARWVGGRVVPIRNHPAASLVYRVGDHKVTLYVYNATGLPVAQRLEPGVARNEPVYTGIRRGFSIAAVERRGVGYTAVATDLDEHETAELVAAVYKP